MNWDMRKKLENGRWSLIAQSMQRRRKEKKKKVFFQSKDLEFILFFVTISKYRQEGEEEDEIEKDAEST